MATDRPLIVIVGPTASGKTALAVEIAQRHSGEIICADSRTVFRGMDIGTAKPSPEQQANVQHWGLDLVEPTERYTAAAFQHYAQEKIQDIRVRDKVPLLVGGSGLYIDGILFDYTYPTEMTADLRAKLESMETKELYEYCIANNIELPINDKNKRHLIRSIAHANVYDQRRERVIDNCYVYGIVVDNATLENRIEVRTEEMFSAGVINEAEMIASQYGWDSEAMTGNIYPLAKDVVSGNIATSEAKEQFRYRDRQLAKRQMTWFRRNPYIHWGTVTDISNHVMQLFTTE